MADDAYNKLEKTIALTKLKSNEYRLWVIQTEATLEVHKCLDIVLGKEPNPSPVNDDGTAIDPIGEQLQARIILMDNMSCPRKGSITQIPRTYRTSQSHLGQKQRP